MFHGETEQLDGSLVSVHIPPGLGRLAKVSVLGLDVEDAFVGESEESLNEESASQPKKPLPEEARDWIRQAKRKTKRLASLIAKVFDQELQKEDPNVYAVVLQSTAALGVFLQVARLGASADWVPVGESLIDEEGLYHLFDYVSAYLFAPQGGLAEVFEEQFGDADEVATCRLLCLWAARRLGADLQTLARPTYWDDEPEEDLQYQMTVLALGLNVLDEEALPPAGVCSPILGEGRLRLAPTAPRLGGRHAHGSAAEGAHPAGQRRPIHARGSETSQPGAWNQGGEGGRCRSRNR